MERLDRLKNDFVRFKEDFSLIGKHMVNSRAKYEDAERRLIRFEDKLITSGDNEETPAPVTSADPLDQLPFSSDR